MPESKIFNPGIMISQIWPNSCDFEGATFRAVQYVAENGFFKAIQTLHVTSQNERRDIANIVKNTGFSYTCTFARFQKQNDLNLSSLIPQNRLKAIRSLSELLNHAREAGAQTVCVMSGPRPDLEEDRQVALEYLSESISILAEKASEYPPIELLIEPGDYFADKKFTLGTVKEGLKLCSSVKKGGWELGLCVDTAHMLLNNEQIGDFIDFNQSELSITDEKASQISRNIREFHFCNAVIEPDHALYGDRHLRFGSPGRLSEEDFSKLLDSLLQIRDKKTTPRLRVYCEVLNTNPLDPNSAINLYWYVRKILEVLSQNLNSYVVGNENS